MYTKNFDNFNFQAFPMGKGKVMVRFENIQDTFDGAIQTQYLDVVNFAKSLYSAANPFVKTVPTPRIQEMSLSGAISMADLKKQQDETQKEIE